MFCMLFYHFSKKLVIIISALIFVLIPCQAKLVENVRHDDFTTDILKKVIVFTDVLVSGHQLTRQEALNLWGQTTEESLTYEVLASGTKGLYWDNFCRNYLEYFGAKHYSLFGVFLHETITKKFFGGEKPNFIFFAVDKQQFRLHSNEINRIQEGIVTIRVLCTDPERMNVCVITIPFSDGKLNIHTATIGNQFLTEAMGVNYDSDGVINFNKDNNELLERFLRENIYDLSVLKKDNFL